MIITTTLVYEPLEFEIAEPLPVLVACYPSEPINWDRVSVAVANEGYVVLATVAGAAYGLAYLRTRNLAAPVLTHFLVDVTWRGFFAG